MTGHLYVDSSFDPATHSGIAGFLLMEDSQKPHNASQNSVITHKFSETTCSKLEIEGFLWSLGVLADRLESLTIPLPLEIFTDSKTLYELPGRRKKLESENYLTRKTSKLHRHAKLYQQVYQLLDTYTIHLNFIPGHKPKAEKSHEDDLFSLVDRETRRLLREMKKKQGPIG